VLPEVEKTQPPFVFDVKVLLWFIFCLLVVLTPLMTMLIVYSYSTAQLQGNVRTRFRRVSHAFRTRPRLAKRGVALTYMSLQLYCEVLRLHGHVSRASQMRPARISDAFGRFLGAELYCTIHKEAARKQLY